MLVYIYICTYISIYICMCISSVCLVIFQHEHLLVCSVSKNNTSISTGYAHCVPVEQNIWRGVDQISRLVTTCISDGHPAWIHADLNQRIRASRPGQARNGLATTADLDWLGLASSGLSRPDQAWRGPTWPRTYKIWLDFRWRWSVLSRHCSRQKSNVL